MAISRRTEAGLELTEPYTMKRLKKALRLYERSKARFEERGLPHTYLGSYLRSSYYDLRIRQSQSNLESIDIDCDNDSDGDYCPKPRKRRKVKNKKTALSSPEQALKQAPEPEPAPDQGQSLKKIVVLPLKSIPARVFLHRLALNDIFSDLADNPDDTEEV